MIKSMTGFGRSEIVKGNRKISVEIKSVNHRYLEAGIKMPKKLNVFESRMRDLLKKYATRGKIDIFINYIDKYWNIFYTEAVGKNSLNCFSLYGWDKGQEKKF